MKTTLAPLRALVGKAGQLAGCIVGNINWSAPPWLRWTGGRARALGRHVAAHPRGWGITVATLAAIVGGTLGGMRWWESHRPRLVAYQVEQKAQVTFQMPLPGALGMPDSNLSPSPVIVRFSLPAAPLDKVGKEPGPGVKLEPARNGKWKWTDNRTLVFTPDDLHWPASTHYTVTLAPEETAPLLKLDKSSVEFITRPASAALIDFAFYTSPADPSVHQVVGELRLLYPATEEEVRQHARLEVLGGASVFAPAPQGTPDLTIHPGQDGRQWFLRSRNLLVPEHEQFVKLSLSPGLTSIAGGEPLKNSAETKARVPDKFSRFNITSADTRMIRTDEGEPQQFLLVGTSVDLESSEVASHIQAWWREDGWSTDDRKKLEEELGVAKPIKLIPMESEAPLAGVHSFRFTEPRPGTLLVRVSPGVKAPGGFELGNRFQDTTGVPEFPKEVEILGKGNILTLGGARRMVVQSRGIDHLRFTVGRVPVSQIQHLITQNDYGDFSNVGMNSSFRETSLVQRWRKIVKVPHDNDWQAVKTELDLHEAPAMTTPDHLEAGHGIFVVEVEPVKKLTPVAPDQTVFGRIETPDDDNVPSKPYRYEEDESSGEVDGWVRDSNVPSRNDDEDGGAGRRFVMITDLGLLVKTGADGKRDVFVMSLGAGQPLGGVALKVLARNGTVLAESTTGTDGKATLPSLEGYKDERQPVAVMALKGSDVSYLPLRERQLQSMDFSRYDTEGVLASRQKAVEGFVFTERGIYRPGDTVHGGLLVRRRDWSPVLEGLPVRITLTDSQGRNAGEEKIRLPYDGFVETKLPLSESAVLGQYHLAAAVLDNEDQELFRLGRASLKVEEFQPDRMKVAAVIDPAPGGRLGSHPPMRLRRCPWIRCSVNRLRNDG
ncbi:MAG: MG2 domain-containing protein [Luteolibacter sp.]